MAEHDDIAASLPRPPPPSPARRDRAIEMAMRRFDGEEPAGSAPAGKRAASGWWPRLTRPQVGAFITLVIVAAVGLPLAWQSWNQWPSVPPAQISENQAEPQPAAREASRSVLVTTPKQPRSVVPTN